MGCGSSSAAASPSPPPAAAASGSSPPPAAAPSCSLPVHKAYKIIDLSDLTVGPQIGVGTTKSVFEGTWQNRKVAVLRKRQTSATTAGRSAGLPREAAAFMQLSTHPHITQLLGLGNDGSSDEYITITELAPLGSVDTWLERRQRAGEPPMALADALTLLSQVARGLQHLAASRFVHTDVSLRNVLAFKLDAGDVCVKLGDLAGAVRAREVSADGGHQRGASTDAPLLTVPAIHAPHATVAVRYAPPEVNAYRLFSERSDVWSYACCGWELFDAAAQPMPYPDIDHDEDVAQAVRAGLRLEQPSRCPPMLWKLLQWCWHETPMARPAFGEISAELDLMQALLGACGGTSLPRHCSAAEVMRRADQLAERPSAVGSPLRGDLALIAADSLATDDVPQGVSEAMRLEHFQIKYRKAAAARSVSVSSCDSVMRAAMSPMI